jgi:AraC-like DNA-binding protein
MQRLSWNMRDVPEAERFAYWREAVCRTYLPLEPENLSAQTFDGHIEGAAGSTLHISRVRSAPAAVIRTRRGIAQFQDGSFYANLQLRGQAIVEQFGRRSVARPGDIVLVDTNEPFSIRFEEVCDLVCATLPDTGLRRHLQRLGGVPANVVANTGAGRLASAYLDALREIPIDFEQIDDLAGHQLTALLTRALSVQTGRTIAPSRREDALRRVLDFIHDELDNPLLSAKLVCRELALSRSTLFDILGEAGIAFAAYIRNARLERSAAQIRNPRFACVTIGEIARRAGFASQETFTRAFRRRFGIAPGAMRPRGER